MEFTNDDYQAAALRLDTAIEEAELILFTMLKPSLQRDGNQWCVLYGDDLQVGIAGFGDSPHKAVLNFNADWHKNIESKAQ